MIFNFFKSKPQENIIFLHLPKAGGTTLRHIFYDQYRYLKKGEIYTINRTKETPEFFNLPQKDRDKIKVLIGHFPFGLHEKLNENKAFTYVTFMRNPIERSISAYYYNREKENSDVYKVINDNNLSLQQYLENNIEPWANNAMTKHLYGATQEEFKIPCTQAMFEVAKENLLNSFSIVGLTEQFDESLLLLKNEFNWENPYYKKQNITKTKQIYTDEDVKIVKDYNKFDVQLYSLGQKLFKSKWEKLSKREEKLNQFKRNNS